MNFCEETEQNHPVKKYLQDENFTSLTQGVSKYGSHIEGRQLDQVYIRCEAHYMKDITVEFKPCYYSDHDQIFITITN